MVRRRRRQAPIAPATAPARVEGSGRHALGWVVAVPIVAAWALFLQGFLGSTPGPSPTELALHLLLSAVAAAGGWLWLRRTGLRAWVLDSLERHTAAIDALPGVHAGAWIALAAGLGLYAELMVIRVHASYFQIFAYFKNVSLLSCFLGLGIGYARSGRRPLWTPLAFPLLAAQIALLHALRFGSMATALQNPIQEQVTFGMGNAQTLRPILSSYGFLVLVFAVNALCFVPLGQLAGRLMLRLPKLRAYGWNLAGSLGGIALFLALSYLWTPPSVWIAVAALWSLAFVRTSSRALLPTAVAMMLVVVALRLPASPDRLDLFSPYQAMTLSFGRGQPPELQVSNVYHQTFLDLRGKGPGPSDAGERELHYSLPYRFKPRPAQVLVLGSGTGNDVAAALRHSAGSVDAVEIDPAILNLGIMLHPESPYQSDRVHPIVTDAREFVRRSTKQYDLIVYGLLDSHTLLTGNASVRLESFVYTVEGFRDARRRLKRDGVLSVTFSLLKPELGQKMSRMLQEAFDGQLPAVFETGYDWGMTFLVGGGIVTDEARRQIPGGVAAAGLAAAGPSPEPSTDDWPFFYMPKRGYPLSYGAIVALLLGVALLLVLRLLPPGSEPFSASCFFLGAGFMLVETKGITELALTYGSTWIVIGAVVAAILALGFLANLAVQRLGNPPRLATYGALGAALLVGWFASGADVGWMSPWLGRAAMTLAVTLPLFFSGFAFSAELDRSASAASGLASNLLGAMLGGFLEYNSMYFGLRSLYVLALLLYVCAWAASARAQR